jgi:RND family efflux transporter MFP subunit
MIGVILRVVFKGLLPIVVIGGTAYAVWILYETRPSAKREPAATPDPVVSVAELRMGSHPVTIEAYGTVVPARQVTLQAQVSGRIVYQHPALVPGGFLPEGSEVIRIDPGDYELRVKRAEVAIESAEASFELERGQQVVAAREWGVLKDQIEASQEMEDFALRRPQRRKAQAEIEAARNELEMANLELQRTALFSPFNALVLEEAVEIGQLISPQAMVAELVGTDRYWVRVSVPFELLDRIRFADDAEGEGSPARVFVNGDDVNAPSKSAHVLRLLGDLSDRGRMARVLVSIDDPLNLAPDADPDARPILLKSYVRVEIDAGTLHDVVEIPRVALRENNQVWVRDADGLLRLQDVDIRWRTRENVLVANTFAADDQLITSRLAVVVPGMRVRVGEMPGTSATARTRPADAAPGELPSVASDGDRPR